MANLPNDIIVDILLKLPVKSLFRFKCLCKQWCSLISDPGFVKLHLHNEDRQSLLLVKSDSSDALYSIDYESPVFNNSLVTLKVELPMPMENKRFDIVGCCNGLLCLLVNGESIVLCNPSTREFCELPSPPGRYPPTSEHFHPTIFGFGYDSSTDDYKVIMGFSIQGEIRMEILALKTNTWHKIQNFNYPDASQKGVLVNGVIHWLAVSYIDSRLVPKIVGLDLVEEKLFEVPQPDHYNKNQFRQLTVLGGCLCLARRVDCKYHEIWLMKEHGVGDSWTKLISYHGVPYHGVGDTWTNLISYPSRPEINTCIPLCWIPHCFMNNGEILIWRDDVKLLICNLDERTIKELKICNGTPSILWNSWSYKESLVSPNKNLISPNESLVSPNEGNVIETNHIADG